MRGVLKVIQCSRDVLSSPLAEKAHQAEIIVGLLILRVQFNCSGQKLVSFLVDFLRLGTLVQALKSLEHETVCITVVTFKVHKVFDIVLSCCGAGYLYGSVAIDLKRVIQGKAAQFQLLLLNHIKAMRLQHVLNGLMSHGLVVGEARLAAQRQSSQTLTVAVAKGHLSESSLLDSIVPLKVVHITLVDNELLGRHFPQQVDVFKGKEAQFIIRAVYERLLSS